MDVLCNFLSADLYCLLKQIFDVLGFGGCSSDSDESIALKRVKKNANITGKIKKLHLVSRPSYTIRHEYPGPLVTYDGEERCEPRLIRFSDLSRSKVDVLLQDCSGEEVGESSEEEEEPEFDSCCSENKKHAPGKQDFGKKKPGRNRKESLKESQQPIVKKKCSQKACKKESRQERDFGCQTISSKEDICPEEDSQNEEKPDTYSLLNFVRTLFPKRKCLINSNQSCGEEEFLNECPPTEEEMKEQEDRARALYEKCVGQSNHAVSWESLEPAMKLRFQWKAFTGDDLKETPYDNFCVSFTRSFCNTFPWATGRTARAERQTTWCNLNRCERLPFILQALLYQVASGAVDPEDHCAVRELFHKLR
ncbi:uncharacterized protein LOC108086876 [Drosophila ficusphila]|uniref:uncharacterized protein LOC108086876 n=1 Tax=Drosophila ficusphila TaxID=30025 RepID=UPI0007E85EF5|nr:uncharacterized protein LOC108086876 [Drosophila ficusphila]